MWAICSRSAPWSWNSISSTCSAETIHVTGIHLEGVEFRVDEAAEEVLDDVELDDLLNDLVAEPEQGGDGLEVRRISVQDLRIVLLGEPGEPSRTVVFEELLLEADELGDDVALSARGTAEGLSFEVAGRFGPLRELVRPRGRYPVRLTGLLRNASFEIDGTLARADQLEGMELRAALEIPELDPWLPEKRRSLPSLGPLSMSARLRHLDDKLQLDQVVAQLDSEIDVTTMAHGAIHDVLGLTGILFDVRIEAEETSALQQWLGKTTGRDLPALGPLLASARLNGSGTALRLENLDARVGRAGDLWARVGGDIQNLLELDAMALEIALELPDLEPFAAELEGLLGGHPLPPGQLRALARLEGSAQAPRLVDFDVRLGASEGQRFQARGGVEDLATLSGLQLDLSLELPDLRLLESWLELEDPAPLALGPLVASARLEGDASTLRLADLDARLGERSVLWAEVRGSVGDVQELRGVSLSARAGAADLRDVARFFDADELELPDLGPLGLEARIVDGDGSLGVEGFVARVGRRGSFFLEAKGAFDDLSELDEIDVEVAWEAPDLELIGTLLDLELPARGPVSGAVRIVGSNERLHSTGTVRVDTTELAGDVWTSFASGTRPSVRSRIRSRHVRLDDLIVLELEGITEPAPQKPDGGGWWENPEPLPFDALHAVDLDIEIEVERVTGRAGLDLSNARLALVLKDGELIVRDVGAEYKGGRVKAGLVINARSARPRLDLRADIDGVNLGRVIAQLQEDSDLTGSLHAAAELTAHGSTVPDLRASLSGRVGAAVREGTIASEIGRAFVFNLVRSIWRNRRPPKDAAVHCLLVGLEIDDGVASLRRFLIEAPDARITASGSLDLAGSTIDVRIQARAHNPGLVSVVPSVDVVGPLTDPSIRLVRRSVATSITRGLASNAVRPGSAALKRLGFRSRSARDDVCAAALLALSD